MARTFRRIRTAAPIAELNVTNLIDLGFTLLIIFMIATPLITQEQKVKVNLPMETKRPQAKDDKPVVQDITITKAGEMFWGERKVTLRELVPLLTDANRREPVPVISIRGDAGVEYGRIMSVLDEVKKQPNLKQIDFPTQTGK